MDHFGQFLGTNESQNLYVTMDNGQMNIQIYWSGLYQCSTIVHYFTAVHYCIALLHCTTALNNCTKLMQYTTAFHYCSILLHYATAVYYCRFFGAAYLRSELVYDCMSQSGRGISWTYQGAAQYGISHIRTMDSQGRVPNYRIPYRVHLTGLCWYI